MPAVPLKLHERAQVSLKIAPRQEQGKGPVGQLRRFDGQVPGVLYGHKRSRTPLRRMHTPSSRS